MKIKNRTCIICLILALFFTGCIKTGTREIILPDQQVYGNQGYLKGCSPRVERAQEVKKKKIYDIEIELPNVFDKEHIASEDKDIWGNQGYMFKGKDKMKYMYIAPSRAKNKEIYQKEKPFGKIPVVAEDESKSLKTLDSQAESEYMDYKVEKGESLWTIAKKIYGDAAKWKLIYEHNKNILRDPKMIKPGMVLRVPVSSKNVEEFIK